MPRLPLLFMLVLLLAPSFAAAQGSSVQVSVTIVAPVQVELGGASEQGLGGGMTSERLADGSSVLSVPMQVSGQTAPIVSMRRRLGEPGGCTVSAAGAAAAEQGWDSVMRCTFAPPAGDTGEQRRSDVMLVVAANS